MATKMTTKMKYAKRLKKALDRRDYLTQLVLRSDINQIGIFYAYLNTKEELFRLTYKNKVYDKVTARDILRYAVDVEEDNLKAEIIMVKNMEDDILLDLADREEEVKEEVTTVEIIDKRYGKENVVITGNSIYEVREMVEEAIPIDYIGKLVVNGEDMTVQELFLYNSIKAEEVVAKNKEVEEIIFVDEKQKESYYKFLELDMTEGWDNERKSLFYLLSMLEETREHINQLYDFKSHWIIPEGLNEAWQTGGSIAVTRLAFNLYNGFNTDEEGNIDNRFSILNIFAPVNREYFEYMFEAINIRFG